MRILYYNNILYLCYIYIDVYYARVQYKPFISYTPHPPAFCRGHTPDERYYSWLGPYLCAPICECTRVCVFYQYTLNFDILPSFDRNSM